MTILKSGNYGFCFGVNRAVTQTLDAAKSTCVACLGDLTHNAGVCKQVSEAGVRIISNIADAKPDETVIIRSHGEAKSTYDELDARGLKFIDLTCPVVVKNRDEAMRAAENHHLLIHGDPAHPEILGIAGWIDSEVTVISDAAVPPPLPIQKLLFDGANHRIIR